MRVAVTGATGNVGTSVVAALAADAGVEEIVAIARRVPIARFAKTRYIQADVARDCLGPHFEGVDAVIHLAWLIQPSRDRRETRLVNVTGSRRVFEAAAAAGARTIVHASSVGAYSPAPHDSPVTEDWPTGGIPTSFYSRDKSEVEGLLDQFELAHASMRVVRLRPALIGKAGAATGIRRLFLGPLAPGVLARRGLLPVMPIPSGLRLQFVHSDDVAEAYRLALHSDVSGALNVAAADVADAQALGQVLGARVIRAPARAFKVAADITWRLRMQPTPAGWIDLAMRAPSLDTSRVRSELGWSAKRSGVEVVAELLRGLSNADDLPTPPLARSSSGALRWREFATGVGGRSY